MYVEIVGRQTGKTTRLVEDAVNFLTTNRDKTVLIVAPHHGTRKVIKKKIAERCGFDCLNRTITSHKMLPPIPGSSMKQYVDEFFYISESDLVIDRNAYYTGTPRDTINVDNIYRLIYETSLSENPKIMYIKAIKKHEF